jgi:signal transduction histidine kinase
MNIPPKPKNRWIFRPVSFFIIWGLLAILLVLNGGYEAKRAKDNLYSLLFDEGAAVIEALTRSAQNSLTSLSTAETVPAASVFMDFSPINLISLDESVIDWILDAAFQIDQKIGKEPIDQERLAQTGKEEKFMAIEAIHGSRHHVFRRESRSIPRDGLPLFYQPVIQGKASYAIQRSEKRTTGQMDFLSVAVARKTGEGVLILRADEADIHLVRRKVILQGLIEEWVGKGDIRYIRFQGRDGEIWADSDSSRVGKKEEGKWIEEIWPIDSGPTKAQTRREKGGFEVIQRVVLEKGSQGIFRVGLGTEKVDQIISGDLRNLIFFSLLLLVFGGIGIVLIYRMENRHLARVREMEGRIHQSEKLSSLANLAAGVAHEIRNPLNAIGMGIQRLQREFPQRTAELQEIYFRFADVLRGEVQRVNEIIEQFLFFSRPSELNLQPLQLKEFIQDLLLLAREPAEQQGIVLETDLNSDFPLVQGDRQRLREALWNLIQNSLQAMPGGGKIRLKMRLLAGKTIQIEIEDTGEGIPEENLSKIFDYYFTTKEKGMGLGLPLAHKIIQGHRGTIQVRSQAGRGTTFVVTLPVFEEKG